MTQPRIPTAVAVALWSGSALAVLGYTLKSFYETVSKQPLGSVAQAGANAAAAGNFAIQAGKVPKDTGSKGRPFIPGISPLTGRRPPKLNASTPAPAPLVSHPTPTVSLPPHFGKKPSKNGGKRHLTPSQLGAALINDAVKHSHGAVSIGDKVRRYAHPQRHRGHKK